MTVKIGCPPTSLPKTLVPAYEAALSRFGIKHLDSVGGNGDNILVFGRGGRLIPRRYSITSPSGDGFQGREGGMWGTEWCLGMTGWKRRTVYANYDNPEGEFDGWKRDSDFSCATYVNMFPNAIRSRNILKAAAREIGLENVVVGRQDVVEGVEGEVVLYGCGAENGWNTYTELRMGRHGQEETGRVVEHTHRENGREFEYTRREWKTPEERTMGKPYGPANILTFDIQRLDKKRADLIPISKIDQFRVLVNNVLNNMRHRAA